VAQPVARQPAVEQPGEHHRRDDLGGGLHEGVQETVAVARGQHGDHAERDDVEVAPAAARLSDQPEGADDGGGPEQPYAGIGRRRGQSGHRGQQVEGG
jgi:hypothetical protein